MDLRKFFDSAVTKANQYRLERVRQDLEILTGYISTLNADQLFQLRQILADAYGTFRIKFN
ncbi:MAG: hypothetical protein NZ482_03770, partial [Gloeomargarita sp. SKYG98]|nr:hypothetical protein [Gloeomargarita sp. SKYG98]